MTVTLSVTVCDTMTVTLSVTVCDTMTVKLSVIVLFLYVRNLTSLYFPQKAK